MKHADSHQTQAARSDLSRRRTLFAILLPLVAGLYGCGADAAPSESLKLYSGAGLRPPVEELAEAFGRRHDVKVECDFAGSETLLGRIKLARRGDLYLPGDVSYVDQARKAGLILSSRELCYLVPVIIVAPGNPRSIGGVADLTQPDLRVGLGDAQACAIGRKCAKIFAKNNVDEESLKRNVCFRSLTVNELGDKVKLGHLDAAIVWIAVAEQFQDAVHIVRIPPEQNVISCVPVGVLSCSQKAEAAAKFVEFASSDEGREIFRKHGYTTESPDETNASGSKHQGSQDTTP